MTRSVRRSAGRSVGPSSVRHYFLKGRQVLLPYSLSEHLLNYDQTVYHTYVYVHMMSATALAYSLKMKICKEYLFACLRNIPAHSLSWG